MARDWVAKFESGEYLREYKGYEPHYITGFYFNHIGGEKEFMHCVGAFYGIGDVEWWIKAELDKLSEEQLVRLEAILKRDDDFCKKVKSHDKIKALADYFGVETHLLYRLGDKNLFGIIRALNDTFNDVIDNGKFYDKYPTAPKLSLTKVEF